MKSRRGLAQGIAHAAARVGNAAAPAVIVAVMSAHGWHSSFFVCALISFVWVALWAVTFTEFPRNHPRVTARELALLPAHVPLVQPAPWWPFIKRMLPVGLVYFCYGWTLWLFFSWVPQYFLHSQNLDLHRSALVASSVFFAGVLGDSVGGFLTTGSALAAIFSPVVFGGNWQLPFAGSMVVMGAGMVLCLRMHPERQCVARLAAA